MSAPAQVAELFIEEVLKKAVERCVLDQIETLNLRFCPST